MQAQIESGTLCPTTMTYGAIAALNRDPELAGAMAAAAALPPLRSARHPHHSKLGGLIGMGMTEKQGGSDVRSNTTRAERSADGSYRLNGHKWFFSAPQCDAHLVLAQTDRGLSCFFMPRRLPDGTLNGIYIQRLKDKVGNRSNASSEVEFHDAWASLLGETGRGVSTILEMGTYTRLDCVIGTAGLMRQAVVQAVHHARHRSVFGARLIDQPLMRGVLADLALESEAATALALRLARAFESDAPSEATLRRALTSAAKFWVCKRGCELAAEAMEVLGGNGYTEELSLARIVREMPVNSIWEGSRQRDVPGRPSRVLQIGPDLRGGAAGIVDGARSGPPFRPGVRKVRCDVDQRHADGRPSPAFCPVVRHLGAIGAAARRRGDRRVGRCARRRRIVLRDALESRDRMGSGLRGGRCAGRFKRPALHALFDG